MSQPVLESQLESLELVGRGKVRDLYNVDQDHLLILASDRLSAFDVVLPDPIPNKGIVLTQISNFWFKKMGGVVANHLTDIVPEDVVRTETDMALVKDRSVVVKKLKPLPVEAVVRGYLIGSGWKDYLNTGQVSGHALPPGLELAAKLPKVIFTPSTKAQAGEHDENITVEECEHLIGEALAKKVAELSIHIYTLAADFARPRGIIIADTKFEFGTNDSGELVLIDEILTPDSSRFWPADRYRPGESPPSFDKQFVRDHLETMDWDKKPPGPNLPNRVIEQTAKKYQTVRTMLLND